ncbi:MAG: dimethyl sulfoxide reductase anchor subunit [Acidobacteriota bacterium]|nr:dimethyl sulfoxide reductase anchor subunit [Acidobacteriota bacterium]
MNLPLHQRAVTDPTNSIVRLTANGLEIVTTQPEVRTTLPLLIPTRPLAEGEQYRFHFDMTKCIGCRSCEVACNEQNNTPADLRWRRVGEIEGGTYPDTARHYLSMGCNHCLTADCIKGCPVDAYTKDPSTGIVLHSADACIGCQYCVWNCPYSVPQFNPERGVVGKCDMCHGRLTEGLEPACVNACPENAIEIEIVNQLAWRVDHAQADAPGMPAAVHTLSTTRITLPDLSTTSLERVDIDTLRPEHPHWSLVWMTSLIQLGAGALTVTLLEGRATPVALTALLALTAFTLNISVLHLGRPAYAWRALKAWRRSWLSREVLLFGLFSSALAGLTASSWLPPSPLRWGAVTVLALLTPVFGLSGILASAYIYLVPARPAWNTVHTPIDFLLSAALLGAAAAPLLTLVDHRTAPLWPLPTAALLWIANQCIRALRLHRSRLYEQRAAASLLLGGLFCASTALVALTLVLCFSGFSVVALPFALAGVVVSRYLFFVSVVPLNMALTFVRSVQA